MTTVPKTTEQPSEADLTKEGGSGSCSEFRFAVLCSGYACAHNNDDAGSIRLAEEHSWKH